MATVRRIHSVFFLSLSALIGLGASACSSDDSGTTDVRRADTGRRGDAAPRQDANPDDTGTTTDDTGSPTPDTGVPVDSGMPDTGRPDTGIPDTGRPDTGVVDTGVVRDTGVPNDTGVTNPDTGVRDTGVRDTGVRDIGVRDIGVRDIGPRPDGSAGDGGRHDGGLVLGDGGPRDGAIRDVGGRDIGVRDIGIRDIGVRDVGVLPDAGTTPAYVESPITAPVWVDACATGTHVDFGMDRDDGHSVTAQTIPFSFTFFGTGYTAIWPVADGYAVFGPDTPTTDQPAQYGGHIPNATLGAVVAPFYTDLELPSAPAGDACILTQGTAPNRTLVIEWLNGFYWTMMMPFMNSHLTFEVVLHEGTNVVDFVYQTLTSDPVGPPDFASGAAASIGLQSPNGARSTRHSGTVSTMAGVRFTPQ